MAESKNIYEKLQDMRVELQKKNLEKTGENKFVGYSYYELKDFIPAINDLMQKNKVTSVVRYGEMATLTLHNIERPEEEIEFISPMSEASLKGTHAVQNLGAVETYLRRYLYITAFEIVENDALDSSQGKVPAEDKNTPQATTELGNCKNCGAPNKLSKAGKSYCSALCWKNPDDLKIKDEPKEEPDNDPDQDAELNKLFNREL